MYNQSLHYVCSNVIETKSIQNFIIFSYDHTRGIHDSQGDPDAQLIIRQLEYTVFDRTRILDLGICPDPFWRTVCCFDIFD